MADVTHILIEYPDQNYERLCRADTGIVIAERKNMTYIFGPEPNKRQSHYFMDDKHAAAFHQIYADRDQKACRHCAGYGLLSTAFRCPHCDGSGVADANAGPAVIAHRNGAPLIALPADSMDIATNVRPMRN